MRTSPTPLSPSSVSIMRKVRLRQGVPITVGRTRVIFISLHSSGSRLPHLSPRPPSTYPCPPSIQRSAQSTDRSSTVHNLRLGILLMGVQGCLGTVSKHYGVDRW